MIKLDATDHRLLKLLQENAKLNVKAVAEKLKMTKNVSIIGLGKLGGRELSLVSDLDIMLVYQATGEDPDLQRKINSCSLEPKLAARYVRDVARAIHHAHQNGVLHRDLKPENIVLINNTVKLADFGWSIYIGNK